MAVAKAALTDTADPTGQSGKVLTLIYFMPFVVVNVCNVGVVGLAYKTFFVV